MKVPIRDNRDMLKSSSSATQRSPVLMRFDMRSIIAVTTAAAGVFAIGREDFWLGSCFAVVLAVPVMIMLPLAEETRNKRIRVFVVSLIVGSLGILLGYVLRSAWSDVILNSRRSDRDLCFSWNAPLLIPSFISAILGGLYVVNERWGNRVRNVLLVTLAVCGIMFGYLLWQSRTERWILAKNVDAFVERTGGPVDRGQLMKEWARRLFGTQHEYAPTIDETTAKADYGKFAGLRKAFLLDITNVDLTRDELKLLSPMPSVEEVTFEMASVPEGGLEGFDLDTVQFFYGEVDQTELNELLSQTNLTWFGAHESKLHGSFSQTMEQLPKLNTIVVRRTELPESFDISRCYLLTSLHLGWSNATDESIAKLAKQDQVRMKKSIVPLTTLCLEGNRISDACVGDLLSFKTLTELDVTDTALTAAGVQKLRAKFPGATVKANPPNAPTQTIR